MGYTFNSVTVSGHLKYIKRGSTFTGIIMSDPRGGLNPDANIEIKGKKGTQHVLSMAAPCNLTESVVK